MVKAGIINVAANSDHKELGGRGPIFGDGTFKFIPIPELEERATEYSQTYGELGLLDFLPEGINEEGGKYVHYDPEFETFTFGDYSKSNGGRLTKDLQSFEKGDYLFFLASLDYKDNGSKREQGVADKGFYIIGYFKIQEILKNVEPSMYTEDFLAKYGNNAHVRRRENDEPFWIFKGEGRHSALLGKAVPFDKSTTIKVIKTTADGSPLTWDGQTEFSKINSYTRNPRVISTKNQLDGLWKAIDEKNPGQSSYADYSTMVL